MEPIKGKHSNIQKFKQLIILLALVGLKKCFADSVKY
jgi:hypothetical protein